MHSCPNESANLLTTMTALAIQLHPLPAKLNGALVARKGNNRPGNPQEPELSACGNPQRGCISVAYGDHVPETTPVGVAYQHVAV